MSCKQFNVYDSEEYHAMHPRRNPVTPAFLAAKKAEIAKYAKKNAGNIPDHIYGLYFMENGEKRYFYVGITNDLARRETQHANAMLDPSNKKLAYVFARELAERGIRYRFEHIGPAEDMTEAEAVQGMLDMGHPIKNDAPAVDGKRKKKKVADVAKATKSPKIGMLAAKALKGTLNLDQFPKSTQPKSTQRKQP